MLEMMVRVEDIEVGFGYRPLPIVFNISHRLH